MAIFYKKEKEASYWCPILNNCETVLVAVEMRV